MYVDLNKSILALLAVFTLFGIVINHYHTYSYNDFLYNTPMLIGYRRQRLKKQKHTFQILFLVYVSCQLFLYGVWPNVISYCYWEVRLRYYLYTARICSIFIEINFSCFIFINIYTLGTAIWMICNRQTCCGISRHSNRRH